MVLYNIYSFSPRRDFVLLVFVFAQHFGVCEFSLTILNVGKGNVVGTKVIANEETPSYAEKVFS